MVSEGIGRIYPALSENSLGNFDSMIFSLWSNNRVHGTEAVQTILILIEKFRCLPVLIDLAVKLFKREIWNRFAQIRIFNSQGTLFMGPGCKRSKAF